MDNLLLTIGIAFVIIVLSVVLLGIGWLTTGKPKIKPGACGKAPGQKRDEESCGTQTSCGLCEKKENKPNSENNEKNR